jgi:uncharacterized protein
MNLMQRSEIPKSVGVLALVLLATALAGCDFPGAPVEARAPAIFADGSRLVPPIRPRVELLPPPTPSLPVPLIQPVLVLASANEGRQAGTPESANGVTRADEGSPDDGEVIVTDDPGGPAPEDHLAADTEPEEADPVGTYPEGGRLGDQLLSEMAPDDDVPLAEDVPVQDSVAEPAGFELLGEIVAPGTFAQLTWASSETFTGTSIPSTVLVANGMRPGPVLCLTAAVHGDELNGIETVRRILHEIDPKRLTGTVVGVPIVNIQGFYRGSRYLPDRRDLNRFFPGNPTGSSAARIAHSLFNNIIVHCTALVDLHTGSFHRTNLPQLRANLNDPGTVTITQGFGSTVILHSDGEEGTLRWAATQIGIPAVTLEAGAPMQVHEDAVVHSVKGIQTLLDTLGMYRRRSLWGNPEPVYYQSRWVRADHGGILSGRVRLGRQVTEGDLLGVVIDPLTNQQYEIRSPFHGRIIGMALDQFVMPGYATFHVGIESRVDEATDAPADTGIDHEPAEYDQQVEQN